MDYRRFPRDLAAEAVLDRLLVRTSCMTWT
jgi:hypothetical protein